MWVATEAVSLFTPFFLLLLPKREEEKLGKRLDLSSFSPLVVKYFTSGQKMCPDKTQISVIKKGKKQHKIKQRREILSNDGSSQHIFRLFVNKSLNKNSSFITRTTKPR